MQNQKLQKRFSFIQRATAFFLAVLLNFPGTNYAAPSINISLPESVKINLLDVSIPKTIGNIQEKFEGRDEKTVFIIQDAHEIPDAQRSIQKIVDFIQKKYGVRLIALEGAASDLDPQIFKSFPDQKILKKVFDQYFDDGELAGGTAAALFNTTPALYHGVEDWGLYEEGLKHFLESMEIENRVMDRLKKLFDEIKIKKEKQYSPELLQIDLALQSFRGNVSNLADVLQKLASVRPPEKGSELALILEGIQRPKENQQTVEIQVKKVAAQIESGLKQKKSKAAKKDLLEFNQKLQEFRQGSSPEAFALFLKNLAVKNKIRVKVSKQLNYLVSNQKRIKDIEGTKFFDDFQKYAQSVKESLFKNDGEKQIDAQSRRLELMERLAKLELSREDWNEVKEIFNENQYWKADQNRLGREAIAELLETMRPQISFYHNAGKRDAAFMQQVESMFREQKTKSAVFIAGGFHAEGVTYNLKSKGISYVLVMPQMNQVPEQTHYRDHMKGEVSWGNYFEVENGKVDLYSAFVRGTRDQLLKLSKEDRGKILKAWRDQILRDLAEKGKIADSREYTRFIDEMVEGNSADKDWEKNIGRFMDGMLNLKSQGNLTEENIAKLFQPSSIPTGATAAPLARSKLRGELLPRFAARMNVSTQMSRVVIRTEKPSAASRVSKSAPAPKPGFATRAEIRTGQMRTAMGMPVENPAEHSRNGHADIAEIQADVRIDSKQFTVGEHTLFIDNRLLSSHDAFGFKSEEDFLKFLEDYLKKQIQLNPPLNRELVIAVLDGSESLFESHISDGFIGIHHSLAEKAKSFPKTAQKMLLIGLNHELSHESLFMENRVLVEHYQSQGMNYSDAVQAADAFIQQHRNDMKGALEESGLWDTVESGMLEEDLKMAEEMALNMKQVVESGILSESAPFASRYITEERSAFGDFLKDHIAVQDEKYGLVDPSDPFYQEIDGLLQPILKAAGLEQENIKLHLVNSDEINAYWIVDSRSFFMSVGLIKTFQKYLHEKGKVLTRDMIAWILAHEVRHLLQDLETKEQIAGEESKNRRVMAQNREYDADTGALFLAAFAGFNPNAALDGLDFLEVLGDIPFLVDHPKADNRKGEVQKILQSPDQFLPNVQKPQIPFSEGFMQNPLMTKQTGAAEKYEKMTAAKNLEELAAQIDSVESLSFFEEWMMYYYVSMGYGLSFGVVQDPDFKRYMSFLLEANNVATMLNARVVTTQAGRHTYESEWGVPVTIENLFRFFAQTQEASSSAPLPILGREPHTSRQAMIDYMEKTVDDDLALHENSTDRESERKIEILKMIKKQFKSLLAQSNDGNLERIVKSQEMSENFTKRKEFNSREEAEREVGSEWIIEVGSPRGDNTVWVTYMDSQAISGNFEFFWQYFDGLYDRESIEQWKNQGQKVSGIEMLGLKEWYRKRYGTLTLPEQLYELEADKFGGLSDERRAEIEQGRSEFLPLYMRFLAFHFFMNKFGPFAESGTSPAPVPVHQNHIEAKIRELAEKQNAGRLSGKSLELVSRIKYSSMFRAHQSDFDGTTDEMIAGLSPEETQEILQDLLSSPPYYLSSMPGQVSSMIEYSSSVQQFQEKFSDYYSGIIKKILQKKAAAQGLDLTDLENLLSLRTKLYDRFEKDPVKRDAFKDLMEFVFSELLKGGSAAELNMLVTEIGVKNDRALKDALFQYLVKKHFGQRDYKSKLELHNRFFPRSEIRSERRLEIIFESVGYDSMDDTAKKDFLEGFLPLFKAEKSDLFRVADEKKPMHQILSYDYMMLLKKEHMGIIEMIKKMDSVNAVVTQLDLIGVNQKEFKALSLADAREVVAVARESKNGYQHLQEALGSIAVTKIKPGLPAFFRTEATRVSQRVKRPNGKVEDANSYQEAMEDKGDYKDYLKNILNPRDKPGLFAGMSFEESVHLVLELFPVSRDRDEILLTLRDLFPQGSAQVMAELLEALIPLEDKGELPELFSFSARPAIQDDDIYAYLKFSTFNTIDDVNLIDVDRIMAQVESRIPDHLKNRPAIQAALSVLRKELTAHKEEFRKAAEADRAGTTAVRAGSFNIAGNSRMMWENSINNAVRDFVYRHLIMDNPYFDYLNLRNFGYGYGANGIDARWMAYLARKDYFLNPAIPFEERLAELTRLFSNDVPLRDNLIANMIALEENRVGNFTLTTLFQMARITGRPREFELISSEFKMDSLTPEQAQSLIDLYKKTMPLLSNGTRQIVLGRKIFELQKKFFPKTFQSFDSGLQEILSVFPKFSLARDSILNEFINMGSIKDFKKLNQVRKYILEEQRLTSEKDIVEDAQRNELWNTLNKLPSRKEKGNLILWLLSPERPLPESLARLSATHHVNFDSLPGVVLSMTRGERDKFFYDALRGYNGLFDIQIAQNQVEAQQVFDNFVNELFDSFFTPGELGDAAALMKDIFRSIFTNYSTERRILLFNSLLNAFIESKNQQQGRGRKIRTILESMGVIGVKVGQYLSEQPGLFKDAPDVQAELKNLKKDAAPFHLRAIFQLLQEAGLMEEIPSLEERIGTASIKQVYKVLMKDGREAAGKFLRPAAEKFLEEDLTVLEATVRMINTNHPETPLPEKMVDEVRELVLEELSFEREVANSKKFAENLAARPSQKQGDFTIKVPEVFKSTPYVIIEEIVHGITLADLILLQKDPTGLSAEDLSKIQKIEARFTETELQAFRAYKTREVFNAVAREFFQQAFGEGFFHADLHYGNAMITPNKEIYMIDLGAAGQTDPSQTQSLLILTVALELGRAKLAESILNSLLTQPISSNPAIRQEFNDLIKAKVPLDAKLMNIIRFIESNNLGANRQLAVYLKALASAAPSFESLTNKEKKGIVSSYLSFNSKLKLGLDWLSSFAGRSEIRQQVSEAAQVVIEALKPQSKQVPAASKIHQVYEVSVSDFDVFSDAVAEVWLKRTEQKTEVPGEDGLGVSQAALAESARLLTHLRTPQASAAGPEGSVTVGVRLSTEENSSFLVQLFKALETISEHAEVLAEADTVKNLPAGNHPNIDVRSIKPMDWRRGFKALRSGQENVPVALDLNIMKDQMEGMFNGILLDWGKEKPGRIVEDFGELLMAVVLIEMARIFSDPAHQKELALRSANPKAKADYLKTQLLVRLADLGYPPEMFTFGENGTLTIQGTLANVYLEAKARAEVQKAA